MQEILFVVEEAGMAPSGPVLPGASDPQTERHPRGASTAGDPPDAVVCHFDSRRGATPDPSSSRRQETAGPVGFRGTSTASSWLKRCTPWLRGDPTDRQPHLNNSPPNKPVKVGHLRQIPSRSAAQLVAAQLGCSIRKS